MSQFRNTVTSPEKIPCCAVPRFGCRSGGCAGVSAFQTCQQVTEAFDLTRPGAAVGGGKRWGRSMRGGPWNYVRPSFSPLFTLPLSHRQQCLVVRVALVDVQWWSKHWTGKHPLKWEDIQILFLNFAISYSLERLWLSYIFVEKVCEIILKCRIDLYISYSRDSIK